MKKDYLIEKNLDKLAGGIRLPQDALEGARRLIYEQGGKNASKRKVYGRLRAVAACAVVVIIAVVSVIIYQSATSKDSINPPPQNDQQDAAPPSSYNLSQLSGKLAGIDELQGVAIPDFGSNSAMLHRAYYDKKTGDTVVAVTKVKSIADHGTDELMIIADIGGGLKDYETFKTGGKSFQNGGMQIVYEERYENGEWYTYAYYNREDTDYYIVIMSPSQNVGEYYFQIFL